MQLLSFGSIGVAETEEQWSIRTPTRRSYNTPYGNMIIYICIYIHRFTYIHRFFSFVNGRLRFVIFVFETWHCRREAFELDAGNKES